MQNEQIELLEQYVQKVRALHTREELETLTREYISLLPDTSGEESFAALRNSIFSAMKELVTMREELRSQAAHRQAVFSELERTEIEKVQSLLDDNLFTYHFQPIIRADNGEIYAYEALMRAADHQGITPFHILKYAELTGRLGEVEQYTFLNVLKYLGEHEALFDGRPVFINSLPNVQINPEKAVEVEELLAKYSGRIVVEMTENSQYNDAELAKINEKYRRLGIPLALDDFGSGYSNISNLLRYTPNIVKIDRMLISGIQNNPNKKHFVREIISLCHANNILALAEGVETFEEMRTVILLDIDLIQGFYTARPSPEIISAIPYELRTEIRTLKQERDDGRRRRIYTAENGEKVSLERLDKDGYSILLIGSGYSNGSNVVEGLPCLETDIRIETADDFSGWLELEYANLSSNPEVPCIGLGENNSVVLTLVGNNKLLNSGIRVPESSKLSFEGRGNLEIVLNGEDYYGIGNSHEEAHGEITFQQDGTISITAESHSGVCIGSGYGGTINIRRGRYVVNAHGGLNVCLGSLNGTTKIDILGCEFNASSSGAFSTVLGSLYGSADISLIYSSIKCSSDSQLATAIGTVHGDSAVIRIESASLNMTMNADALTALGSLAHDSDISVIRSSVKVNADGANALLFGGLSGGTRLNLTDIDCNAAISTELSVNVIAEEKDIRASGGKIRISQGGQVFDKLLY